MKVKILEYKIYRGDKVKVQSHNKRKGKWIENPKWSWHKRVASGETTIMFGIAWVKEYEKELK